MGHRIAPRHRPGAASPPDGDHAPQERAEDGTAGRGLARAVADGQARPGMRRSKGYDRYVQALRREDAAAEWA